MTDLVVRAHDVFSLYPTPRGQVVALRGLTLDVAAGERVVVHGPNGSGKTTLMRVLTGELAPSAGTVSVCGVALSGARESVRARLRAHRIGMVEQYHARSLQPELTVLENVALHVRLAGTGRRAATAVAARRLEDLGLGHLAHRRPATLSGGEAQRVAVCAAVAHAPQLILADEPTGELDRASADEVYDLLSSLSADLGAALLVVSHDARAARIADRIVRIRDGRLSEEWRPDDETESLVLDDRGWVRLPEALRQRSGVMFRARASAAEGVITLAAAPRIATAPSADSSGVAVPVTSLAAPRRGETPVAELTGITVNRGGRTVIDALHLTVRRGLLTVVRGRSGSGKTTLLRVLAGLERPDRGVVRVAGQDIGSLDRAGLAAMRRRHMGVAGQGTALLETMDVDENLDLARMARGLPADRALTDAWVARLDLAAVRDRPVQMLSGGERQRVAVARVLVVGADLALLDEPTSRQDEAHAELVVAALTAAAQQGVAVVAATHDPILAGAADVVLDLD